MLTEEQLYEKAIEYRDEYWKKRGPQIMEAAEFGYIVGAKTVLESEDYKQLSTDAQSWKELQEKLVDCDLTPGGKYTSIICMVKAKPVIMTTYDGKAITDDTTLLYIIETNKWDSAHNLSAMYYAEWRLTHGVEWKVFSSEEVAQEYMKNNKPLLSLEDCKSVYIMPGVSMWKDLYEGLKRLVEQKLKGEKS